MRGLVSFALFAVLLVPSTAWGQQATDPVIQLLHPVDGLTTRDTVTVTLRVLHADPVSVHYKQGRGGTKVQLKRDQLFTVRMPVGEKGGRLRLRVSAGGASVGYSAKVERLAPLGYAEFKLAFRRAESSQERYDLVRRLELAESAQGGWESSPSLTTLLSVLRIGDWYVRTAAIRSLADVCHDPALVAYLETKATVEADPREAEGILLAFGSSGVPERAPFLIEQLPSKKWLLRLAAVRALRALPSRSAIAPLIGAWEAEDRRLLFRELNACLETLLPVAGGGLSTPQEWRDYWTVFSDRKGICDPPPENRKLLKPTQTRTRRAWEPLPKFGWSRAEVGGIRFHVFARDRPGPGIPIVVLPEPGLSTQAYRPYLESLEVSNELTFVELPRREDFLDGQPAAGEPYPLTRVAKALGALIEARTKKRYALLTFGLSGWLGLHLARDGGAKRVRRLILTSVPSGSLPWAGTGPAIQQSARAAERAELTRLAGRLPDLAFAALEDGDPDARPLERAWLTCRFADQRSLEIAGLHSKGVWRPLPGFTTPAFAPAQLAGEPIASPCLVTTGEFSTLVTEDEGKALEALFDPKIVRKIRFKLSADAPWIEENEKFVEIVRRFCAGRRKKPDKKPLEPKPR